MELEPAERREIQEQGWDRERAGSRGALAAVIAVTLVALALFGRGAAGYEVTAKFINAGQVVKGNPVQTGGTAIGTVKDIAITADGQAEIKLAIDAKYAPLREGTRAAIKQLSQSGIANRYVDLSFPRTARRRLMTAAASGATRRARRSTSTSCSTRSTRRPERRCRTSSRATPASSAGPARRPTRHSGT